MFLSHLQSCRHYMRSFLSFHIIFAVAHFRCQAHFPFLMLKLAMLIRSFLSICLARFITPLITFIGLGIVLAIGQLNVRQHKRAGRFHKMLKSTCPYSYICL